ncbi:hypothetical protein [Sphingomonas sp.]|uniref:hypothetical protein n=1 Tax=Sphingomonas sp. TaxID=28214 RepID=UPI003BAD81CF
MADFFCPAKGLVVEIDGDTHRADRDEARASSSSAPASRRSASRTARCRRISTARSRRSFRSWSHFPIVGLTTPRLPRPNPSPEGEGLEARSSMPARHRITRPLRWLLLLHGERRRDHRP